MKKADIVKQIVDCLFTSGRGDEATRLVLELPGKKDGGGWCRRAVEDQIDQVLTACDLPFLDEDFLILMNEIGRYGEEKYGVDSFHARAQTGDRSRGSLLRTRKEQILNHARQHIADYENGILHDHFGDASHQLAAAAFYFSKGE
jgi:hypothetical protein